MVYCVHNSAKSEYYMTQDILDIFGLSSKSKQVLLDILGHGVSSVATIAARLGMPKSSVYDAIPPLLEQSLVNEYSDNRGKTYGISDNEQIARAHKEKIEQLQKAQASLLELLTTRHAQDDSPAQPKIKFYSGTLGIKQWAVLGHSYGGYVAQAYALKYPGAVSYLILVDTSPSTRLIPKQEAPQLLARKMTPEIAAELGNLGKVVTKAVPEGGNEEWQRIWHAILPIYFNEFPSQVLIPGDRTVYNEHALVLGGALMATFDTRPMLAKLALPTLVAVGRWDAILPISHSEILYKSIPGAQLVVFERSGHFPFVEEPGRFVEVVRSFLGE